MDKYLIYCVYLWEISYVICVVLPILLFGYGHISFKNVTAVIWAASLNLGPLATRPARLFDRLKTNSQFSRIIWGTYLQRWVEKPKTVLK